MAVNRVVFGNTAIMDISDTTATADKVLQGYTAYGANGVKFTGTAQSGGGGGGGGDVYTAINRSTNVNVADTNLSTVMARGIYAGTSDMSAGDPLMSGVIYLVYEA